MKKFSTTFLLLGFLALLSVVVFFFATDSAEERRNQSETDRLVLKSRQVDALDQIVFSPIGSEKLSLSKTDGQWMIESGLVDQDELDKLMEELRSFSQGKMVSKSRKNWEKYGVTEESSSKIVLVDGDEEFGTFYFGSVGPSYQTSYVRRSDDDSVYLVTTSLDDMLRYDVSRWKNKALFLVDREQVQSVSVRVGSDKWQFKKDHGKWMYLEGDEWNQLTLLDEFNTYLDQLYSLKAVGLEPDDSLFETADNAIALGLQDGTEYVVTIDGKEASQAFAKTTLQQGLFRLSSDLSARLKPDFLKVPEVEPEVSSSTETLPLSPPTPSSYALPPDTTPASKDE